MKTDLNSSMIQSAEWADEILTLTWKSGQKTDFRGVPQSTYEALVAAESPGKYYHQNIKDKF